MERYDGQDLLADVFPGTENAPEPVPARDAGGNVWKFYASPDDPRWDVQMSFTPLGELLYVHSCVPRETA